MQPDVIPWAICYLCARFIPIEDCFQRMKSQKQFALRSEKPPHPSQELSLSRRS